MAGRRSRRGFGYVRRLPSKRWQASYVGPDTVRHTAPVTYDTSEDAEAWLTDERRLISAGTWRPPAIRAATVKINTAFGTYATGWLARRDLKPRTRELYQELYDAFLEPTFGEVPLVHITPAKVATWHHDLGTRTGPTRRAHAYGLMKVICKTAVDEDEIPANPCRVRGASTTRRAKTVEPATLEQLSGLVEEMPERLRVMVLLSSWCGLRFGEATELRRKDIDTVKGIVKVRRGVTWVSGKPQVGTPKSAAGSRDVAIPPHLLPIVRRHILEHTAPGNDGLLFPAAAGGHLSQSSLNVSWWKAREAVGRPDLRWHDLRHTGATLAASTGATLAELMARLGHSTPGAALRYQHAAQGRDVQIAALLSEIATRHA